MRIAGQEPLAPATPLVVEGLCLRPCGPSPIVGCPQEAAWLNAPLKGNGPWPHPAIPCSWSLLHGRPPLRLLLRTQRSLKASSSTRWSRLSPQPWVGTVNSSFLLPQIYQKIPSTDPSSNKTQQVIASIRTMSLPGGPMASRHHYSPIYLSCAMLLAALSWQYLSTISKATEEYVQAGEN